MKGSEFAQKILNLSGQAREDEILKAVQDGSVPAFIATEHWIPVKIGPLEIFVTPDYFSIGTNDDFFRVPMNPYTAQRIADAYHAVLPTRQLVNAIYSAADTKVAPRPFPPDGQMESTARFIESNTAINKQLSSGPSGNLTAGHKKDVVVGPGLDGSKVAIYGWHQLNGLPIQPYSTIHGSYYADYSHGVRLIFRKAFLDGKAIDLLDLANEASTAKYVSDQGPFYWHFPTTGGGPAPLTKTNYATGTTVKAVPNIASASAVDALKEKEQRDTLFTVITIAGFAITLINFIGSGSRR